MEYISLQQGAEKVLRLSRRMLETAEIGDWTLLGQLEQERSRSLDSLFQHPSMPEQMYTISEALRQVMEFDRQCIAMGEQAKAEYATELRLQAQGEQAVRSYLDCQS